VSDDWDSVSSPVESTGESWDAVSSPAKEVAGGDAVSAPLPPRKPRLHIEPSILKKAGLVALILLVVALGGLGAFEGMNQISIHFPSKAGISPTAAITLTAMATAQGNATATAIAQAAATLTSSPPMIVSVSQFLPTQNQTITISGRGFGTYPPFVNHTSDYLKILDASINWSAGYSADGYRGDSVTISVSSWTDSQIVITGFSGAYGQMGLAFNAGNNVTIYVWNPQTGAGPAAFNLVVTN
jgi:hypothetical protein